MSTEKIRLVRIECDQCGYADVFDTRSRRAAEGLARDACWDIGRGNIADLCGRCVEADSIAAVSGVPVADVQR